jgi:hypothetical protein
MYRFECVYVYMHMKSLSYIYIYIYTYKYTVHVEIPRTLARLAKEAGCTSFIQMSALSADLESNSQWSVTKAKGELAVKEEFPEAVSIY